jgi:hypothetical protein
VVGVETVHPLRGFPLPGIGLQPQLDVDPFDDQDLPFELDLSGRLANEEPFTGRNLTRLQRASEGSGQSTRCGRDHVVEGRGVLFILPRLRAVVSGDRPVCPEPDRMGLGWEPSPAHWTLHPLDADLGTISNVGHGDLQQAQAESGRALPATPISADVQGKTELRSGAGPEVHQRCDARRPQGPSEALFRGAAAMVVKLQEEGSRPGAPGRGTAVPGGLTSREASPCCVRSAECAWWHGPAEVAPALDHPDLTCRLGAWILYEGLALRALASR